MACYGVVHIIELHTYICRITYIELFYFKKYPNFSQYIKFVHHPVLCILLLNQSSKVRSCFTTHGILYLICPLLSLPYQIVICLLHEYPTMCLVSNKATLPINPISTTRGWQFIEATFKPSHFSFVSGVFVIQPFLITHLEYSNNMLYQTVVCISQ